MAKKRKKDKKSPKCQWQTLHQALAAFVTNVAGHQSAEHIRPLHWYVACRLVIEGGFRPEDVRPRPPFEVSEQDKRWFLRYSDTCAGGGELTVLGGLKTKIVDVVVAKDGIGPVIAASMKGTLNAFRNLTNRMEEAVGDCTNPHIAYPALVYGFLHVLRANHEDDGISSNDVAIHKSGAVSEGIKRYHGVMKRLAARDDIRDDTSKYESIAICLADPRPGQIGSLLPDFPPPESLLAFSQFFDRLYKQYDLRYVYSAPGLAKKTTRLQWDPGSPVMQDARITEYPPRIAQ